jgi:hypothetical protein
MAAPSEAIWGCSATGVPQPPDPGSEIQYEHTAGEHIPRAVGSLTSRTSMGLGFGVPGYTSCASIAGASVQRCGLAMKGRLGGDINVLTSNRKNKLLAVRNFPLPSPHKLFSRTSVKMERSRVPHVALVQQTRAQNSLIVATWAQMTQVRPRFRPNPGVRTLRWLQKCLAGERMSSWSSFAAGK